MTLGIIICSFVFGFFFGELRGAILTCRRVLLRIKITMLKMGYSLSCIDDILDNTFKKARKRNE